jgi:hypothetical protein
VRDRSGARRSEQQVVGRRAELERQALQQAKAEVERRYVRRLVDRAEGRPGLLRPQPWCTEVSSVHPALLIILHSTPFGWI